MKALAKQIVGHGRKVVFDDAEAQKDYETLRVVQADARQLLAQLDALTRSSETCANDGKSALECYEALGPKWAKEGFDDVARVVRGSVGLLRQAQSLEGQLQQEIAASVAKPLRDLNDAEFAKAKAMIKKTQEQRAAYQDIVVTMEREKKKGKITALDAENQIKRAGADYDICEAECKKAMRSAIQSSQTSMISISCNYLAAYSKFWEAGAKMGSLLLATAGKHRQVASERAEKSRADDTRVLRCFGVDLAEVVRRDGRPPAFVFELIAHISATALSEEGIFRVPGNLEALNQYKKRIDSGLASGIVNKDMGPHDAAGLLKLYLRELPTPLFPFGVYDALVKINVKSINMASTRPEDINKRAEVVAVLGTLPPYAYQIVKEIVYMATLIAAKSAVNKMDAANIARSLAPGLMRSDVNTGDMMAVLAASHASNDLFEHFIEHYAVYFEVSLAALAAAGGTDALERVLGMSGAPALLLAKDERGRTPLHAAALHGHTDAVALLLDRAPNPVATLLGIGDDEGNTALHLAVQGEHLETAGLLLQRGSSMDATNKAGSSVWDVAALVGADAAKRIQDAAASFKAGNLRVSGKKVASVPASAASPRSGDKPPSGQLAASSPLPVSASSSSPASAPLASSTSSGSLLPAPPRPKGKETTVTVTSTHEEVVVAIQPAAPPVPRRGSVAFKTATREASQGSLEQQAVLKQQAARVSTARALPARMSMRESQEQQQSHDKEEEDSEYVWTHVEAEPFYEVSQLVEAVESFCLLLCNERRSGDTMEVRQSLKEVARGLQTFFKSLDATLKPFQEDDSVGVREVAGRLKDCAGELLAVVRDVSAAKETAKGEKSNQTRLAEQAYRLSCITLELFDVIELGKYRVINLAMQKTAEEAAHLAKANTPSEVGTHRDDLKSAAVSLASGAVAKALKQTSEKAVTGVLVQQGALLRLVRDLRHPEASAATRATLAKNIILSCRAAKTLFREADEAMQNESRSDGALLEAHLAMLIEIRAPEDYVPANRTEGRLLSAVGAVHDELGKLSSCFASEAWRELGEKGMGVASVLGELLAASRASAGRGARAQALLAALEHHVARVLAALAHSAAAQCCAARAPAPQGPARPGLAVAGLVVAMLQAVPELFKNAKKAD